MAKPSYSMIISLDGYTEDAQGRFGKVLPKTWRYYRFGRRM